MPRLPVLIRQNAVFELVVQGRSYAQICQQLQISDDTVARDMQAIGEQVQTLVRERAGEIVAVALATYQTVIDHAWREYRAAAQRERDWYAGRLDFAHETVATKTLALDGEADDDAPIAGESAPIEVKRTRKTVRPTLVSHQRREWLAIIMDATREITELTGVKKLIVEHHGKDGGAIAITSPAMDAAAQELAAWRKQMSDALSSLPSAPPTPPISPTNT
jgi:hypothetical protein